MKEYLISYNGKIYSNLGYFFLGEAPNIITITNNNQEIEYISKFKETEDCFILEINKRFASVIEDKLVLDDKSYFLINFNKNNFRATGDKFTDKNIVDWLKKDSLVRPGLILFISKVIGLNSNLKEFIENTPSYLLNQSNPIVLQNFFNMLFFNYPELEKLITSKNMTYIENNLDKENFEVTEASKLNEVIGVPKFVLNDLKTLKLEDLIDNFKALSNVLDGNSLKIVLKFLEDMQLIYTVNYKPNIRISKLSNFLKYVTKICERKTYKITDLLNYFLRQAMYTGINGYFSFPCEEAMYLSDYLDMCDKYGLKAEKYPSQLKRVHDIVAKNVAILERKSDEFLEEFKLAVNDYRFVERDITISVKNETGYENVTYTFIVPRAIRDIIEEGNSLHHCVGSYSDKIINKQARIVFMRYKETPKDSLVTIDIDENCNLIEAKKAFNEDVDEQQMKAINNWRKEIKIERGIL